MNENVKHQYEEWMQERAMIGDEVEIIPLVKKGNFYEKATIEDLESDPESALYPRGADHAILVLYGNKGAALYLDDDNLILEGIKSEKEIVYSINHNT